MARLTINGQTHNVDVAPDTPLLWAIRENVGLTGTKYGCGIAQCGSCTVHVDGEAVRSCALPVSAAEGKQITTIEGLASGATLHKVQKAWVDHDVPQCGYCQAGMIMAVAALLKQAADVNAPQGDGMTALHWAAMHDDPALATMLLYAGASPKARTRVGGYTPLLLAATGFLTDEERAWIANKRGELTARWSS